MTWSSNWLKLKPPVKNTKNLSIEHGKNTNMFSRSMANRRYEWRKNTLRHERWLWVRMNLMKMVRKHFVRVSYARTAHTVIGISSTLAFLPVAFRVVAYCTLAFCQWLYCLWHYAYWHYSQWRFVLWLFICGVLSRDLLRDLGKLWESILSTRRISILLLDINFNYHDKVRLLCYKDKCLFCHSK